MIPLMLIKPNLVLKNLSMDIFFFGLGVQDENILNGVLVEHNHIDFF